MLPTPDGQPMAQPCRLDTPTPRCFDEAMDYLRAGLTETRPITGKTRDSGVTPVPGFPVVYACQPRPCGVSQTAGSGPAGTICVGLMSVCTT